MCQTLTGSAINKGSKCEKGNNCSNQSTNNMGLDKRPADEPLGGTDQAHCIDEEPVGMENQANCIADERDANDEQNGCQHRQHNSKTPKIGIHHVEQRVVVINSSNIGTLRTLQFLHYHLDAVGLGILGFQLELYSWRQRVIAQKVGRILTEFRLQHP